MLRNFFEAKSIAIIGVSRDQNKVGHVILRNLIDGGYNGKVFVVNPNAAKILNKISYDKVSNIDEKVELAIIAVDKAKVMDVIKDCGRKRIKNVIIISSGFSEVGDKKLEEKLKKLLEKYGIRAIGPNCLGTYDAYTKLDSMFLPRYRMKRPEEGYISFVSQSGALGSAIIDFLSNERYGFNKFISYGNAIDIDESDILKFLDEDTRTRVICLYIEGLKDGKKFMNIIDKIRKPVVVLKGGISEEGNKATLSHTGSLAGNYEAYKAVFKKYKLIMVENLEDMFNVAKLLEKGIKIKKDRILVITNGGGYGILSTDYIVKNGLRLAELNKESVKKLRKDLPKIVNIRNPLDLAGDANVGRYKVAIEEGLNDKNVDLLLVTVLYQTPLIEARIVDMLIEMNNLKKKPIVIVSTGGEFTELLNENLENNGIPCFRFPNQAVRAIKLLVDYYNS